MNAIVQNSRGLTLLIAVNWDRIVALLVIAGALAVGASLGGQ